MGTTLDNGIYLPDEGERNCYEGLAGNWVALDNHLGSTNIHVTINDKQAWNGHVADTTIHVTSADKQAWNGKADSSALTAHTGNTTIHVTAEDKSKWDAVTSKADASALTAHTGDTTIHVTAEDKSKWDAVTSKADASALTAHTGDTTIHVTAADKQTWDTVTTKANDADVVHNSGDETVGGSKTFTNSIILQNSDTSGVSRDHVCKSQVAELGDAVSGDSTKYRFVDKNNNEICYIRQRKLRNSNTDMSFCVNNIDNDNNSISAEINFIIDRNNDPRISPSLTDFISLGRPTFRWKNIYSNLINGLTPSSLSLPSDRSARIDISSYFTNTGTGQSNSYTVPANGYIYLTLSELTNIHCFSRTSGNVTNYAQTFTKPDNSTGVLYVLFPVRKNDVFVTTWYTTTTVSVDGAFFIPCKGNI